MRMYRIWALVAVSSLLFLTACGGGGSSSTGSSNNNSGNGSNGSTTNNSVPLVVDSGPANEGEVNLAYVTLTVCVPTTTTCQQINHVQIDTGSEGLRVLPGALGSLSLAQQTSGSNTVSECVVFGDNTFVWGPVASADIQISGEVAKNVPIQIISNSTPPSSCGSGDTQISDATGLGANAILGIGLFRQDCGIGCESGASTAVPNWPYYGCASGTCNVINELRPQQLQNPVWMFATDNNGAMIQLAAISNSGALNPSGALIFGIGTQADNAVGSATLLQPDPSTGNFAATFNGNTYNDYDPKNPGSGHGSSFIDSGSNGYFFLDSATLVNSNPSIPVPDCPSVQGFYCPTNPQTISVNVIGESSSGIPVGSGRTIQFTVANAQTLFQSGNTAFNDVGGPNSGSFDFGLPFFFGKKVYFGIEGQPTPLGNGPLYAF